MEERLAGRVGGFAVEGSCGDRTQPRWGGRPGHEPLLDLGVEGVCAGQDGVDEGSAATSAFRAEELMLRCQS